MDKLQDNRNHMNASEDEFWPLSGKPCFNVIIEKKHMWPLYHLVSMLYYTKMFYNVLWKGEVGIYRDHLFAASHTI